MTGETIINDADLPGNHRVAIRTVAAEGLRATVRIRGTLDAANGALLAEVLTGHLRLGHRYLRLDMSRADVCGTLPLEVLRRAHRQLLDAHGVLMLTGVGERLARVFAAAGLDGTLFLGPSVRRRGPCRQS